jgi:hypothetical protein
VPITKQKNTNIVSLPTDSVIVDHAVDVLTIDNLIDIRAVEIVRCIFLGNLLNYLFYI